MYQGWYAWSVVCICEDVGVERTNSAVLESFFDGVGFECIGTCMHVFLDKVLNGNLFSSLLENIITPSREGISQWPEDSNIERLKAMGGMGWETKYMDVFGHCELMKLFRKVRPMAIKDEEDWLPAGVVSLRLRKEGEFKPLLSKKVIRLSIW